MDLRQTLQKYLAKAHAEASLRDEISKYLYGEWLDQLVDEVEHEAKRWWWTGVGIGLLIGIVVAGSIALIITG